MKCENRTGFTLIEMLVVVLIISVIAAILLPVMSQAKFASRKTDNSSHLRQVGMAMNLYVSDCDEMLPTWNEVAYESSSGLPKSQETVNSYWDAKLFPYSNPGLHLGNQNAADYSGVWHSSLGEDSSAQRSYGLNQLLVFSWDMQHKFDPDVYKWRYISSTEISMPAEVILVGDGGREGRLAPPRNWDGWSDKYVKQLGYYRRDAPWRYGGKSCYVFTDGHLKYLDGNYLYPSPVLSTMYSNVLGLDQCSQARWFAPTGEERKWNRDIAAGTYGVICP